jgi:hypothetical protein
MKDLLRNIASRGKPVADIEQGYISTTSCILANNAMKLGRTLTWDAGETASGERRRGQQAPAPTLPATLAAPRTEQGVINRGIPNPWVATIAASFAAIVGFFVISIPKDNNPR